MDTGGPMDGLTADQCHSYASRSDGSLVGPHRGKWLLPRCWLRATKEIRGIFALGLPARRERQCRRAAERRYELAPVHSMLRHSAGYALAGRGVDTRTLQAFMGRRSISNTVIYTAVADKRVRNIWQKRWS
jgi:integrase